MPSIHWRCNSQLPKNDFLFRHVILHRVTHKVKWTTRSSTLSRENQLPRNRWNLLEPKLHRTSVLCTRTVWSPWNKTRWTKSRFRMKRETLHSLSARIILHRGRVKINSKLFSLSFVAFSLRTHTNFLSLSKEKPQRATQKNKLAASLPRVSAH